MNKLSLMAGAFVLGIVRMMAVSALLAFPVIWLWNYAAVDLLAVRQADFWHALTLLWLCGFLFRAGASK